MRRIFNILLFVVSISISSGIYAQPSPNGGDSPSGGNTPMGGGAPIGSGVVVLLALGAMYGSKKAFNLNKKENE